MRRSFKPCNTIITIITTTAQWLLSATGTTTITIIIIITIIDNRRPASAGLFAACSRSDSRSSGAHADKRVAEEKGRLTAV